ncbi:MAG: MFS transporter, partial [Nocardioidaceae bacterium]|nr:MFS transporter [Nocardioidaceae bacterium]
WVITQHSWRTAFAVLGVIGLLWALAWSLIGKDGPVGTSAQASGTEASRLSGYKVPLPKLMLTGTFLGALAATAAAYVSLAILLAYLPAYLKGPLDYSDRDASLLFVLPWLMAAILVMGQGVLTRRLMERGVSTRLARGAMGGFGLVISAAFTLLFAHSTSGVAQIICMSFAFSVSGLIFATSSTVCGELTPPSQRGAVLGTYVAIASLAGVVAPVVTGRLIDAATHEAEGYVAAFTLMAVVMIIGGLIALIFIRPERDAEILRPFAIPVGHVAETTSGGEPTGTVPTDVDPTGGPVPSV